MVVTVGSEADASVTTAAPSSEPAMSFAAIATATLNAVPAVSDPSARLATVDPPSTTSSDSAPATETSSIRSLAVPSSTDHRVCVPDRLAGAVPAINAEAASALHRGVTAPASAVPTSGPPPLQHGRTSVQERGWQ